MTTTTTKFPGELESDTPIAMRRQALNEDFIPYIKGVFAARPELKSALFGVAQYWADEADDAVHDCVIFSSRETPLWPHDCRWDDEERTPEDGSDVCSSCSSAVRGGDLRWMPFDDNGSAIVAFQSCCREDASQESSTARAYLPYAVGRRLESGDIDVEIVGGPIRAWLDEGRAPNQAEDREDDLDPRTRELFDLVYASPADDAPRQVLADWLQQKDDPLGHYIALSLSKRVGDPDITQRKKALERRHARDWLGELLCIVPEEYAKFGRGFVQSVAVHLDANIETSERHQRALTSRVWGTVESLTFLPQSRQVFSPSMTGLRSVAPLNLEGVRSLAENPQVLRSLEHVHVALTPEENTLASLVALSLPNVRSLTVTSTIDVEAKSMNGGDADDDEEAYYDDDDASAYRALIPPQAVDTLLGAPLYKQLDEIILGTMGTSSIAGWFAMPRSQRPRTITFTTVSAGGTTSGFRVRVTDDTVALVDMQSFNGESSFELLGRALAILPKGARVQVASSVWFAPTDDDLGILSKLADRPVTRSR